MCFNGFHVASLQRKKEQQTLDDPSHRTGNTLPLFLALQEGREFIHAQHMKTEPGKELLAWSPMTKYMQSVVQNNREKKSYQVNYNHNRDPEVRPAILIPDLPLHLQAVQEL